MFKVSEALIPNHCLGNIMYVHTTLRGETAAGKLKKTLFYFMVYVLLCVREEMRYSVARNKIHEFLFNVE